MEKTHDYIHYYRGYWSDGGKCRIRIYREEDHIHALRHSASILLLFRGVPVNVVSDMAGHGDPAITLTIYGHIIKGVQEGAADTMDEVFS